MMNCQLEELSRPRFEIQVFPREGARPPIADPRELAR